MSTAPKVGPVVNVQLRYERDGHEAIEVGHWAYGDGDGLMPAFGPAWFKKYGLGYLEIPGEPTGWAPLDSEPKGETR